MAIKPPSGTHGSLSRKSTSLDSSGGGDLTQRVNDVTQRTNELLGTNFSTRNAQDYSNPTVNNTVNRSNKNFVPQSPANTQLNSTQSPQDTSVMPKTPPVTQEVPYAQALKNLQSGGMSGNDLATAQETLRQHYQGFMQTDKAKTEAPATGAAAIQALGEHRDNVLATQQTPATKPVVTPEYQQHAEPVVTDAAQKVFDAQKAMDLKTLLAARLKAKAESQITSINTEMMNTQKIMNGTESDIRSEIVKGGGTGSDAQVQALTGERNKVLLKNYNDQELNRANMINALNLKVNLAEADKQAAVDNYNTAVGSYQLQDKINTETSTRLDKLVTNVGYSGLAQTLGGNPASLSLAEKNLGLPQGTLSDPSKLKFLETYRQQSLDMGLQRLQISVNNQATSNDPDVLNGMISYYKSTGAVPPFGMGNAALRSDFWKAIGQGEQTGENIVSDAQANKATVGALTKSISNQQTIYSATKTSLSTLDKQLSLLESYSSKVDRSGTPILNKYLLFAKGQYGGDADTVALQNIVTTASNEFAKILNGSAASISGATVSSQEDAAKILNANMTPAQIKGVISVMRREGNYRLSSQQETINQMQSDLRNVGTKPTVKTFNIGGSNYSVGQKLSNGSVTLTVQSDGTLLGSDGLKYDANGNLIR